MRFTKSLNLDEINQFVRGNLLETPRDTIGALDVFANALPSQTLYTIGRSFFSPERPFSLGSGVEAYTGHFQSWRPTQSGLMLNIDVSAAAFVEAKPVVEIAMQAWVCVEYPHGHVF